MTPTRFSKLRSATQPELSRAQDAVARTLEPLAGAVGRTPIMGAPPPPWLSPAQMLADFAAVAARPPRYHKDALGYVHGKGAVSTAAGQAAGTPIFLLPQGYLPGEPVYLPVRYSAGTVMNLTIQTDGTVLPQQLIVAGGSVELTFFFLAER